MAAAPTPNFIQTADYFPLHPSIPTPPAPDTPAFTNFLSSNLSVQPLVTGPFTRDLTASNDDLLLAILSLLLLLAIEGVTSTLLLRTRHGFLHSRSFSLRQFTDLLREFKLRAAFRGHPPTSRPASSRPRPRSRPLDWRLVVSAVVLVSLTFGLQVLVLFLTTPGTRPVSNDLATFRLVDPLMPQWDEIRLSRNLANQPCSALSLNNVEQGVTRISGCLTSNVSRSGAESSLDAQGRRWVLVDGMTFVSDLHEFGGEHELILGDQTGLFSSRAYFRLIESPRAAGGTDQGGERLMPRAEIRRDREKRIEAVHMALVGMLYAAYNREVGGGLTLEELNQVRFEFEEVDDPDVVGMVDVVRTNQGRIVLQSAARRYITTARGQIPGGHAALLFAEAFLKASVGVIVSEGNIRDLMMASGNTYGRQGVLWLEGFRWLNWLSLGLLLFITLVVLVALRWGLKPVAMGDLAGMYVEEVAAGGRGSAWDSLERREGVEQRFGVDFRSTGVVEDYYDERLADDEDTVKSKGGWRNILGRGTKERDGNKGKSREKRWRREGGKRDIDDMD